MGYHTEYRCDRCGAIQGASTVTLRFYVLENKEKLGCRARLGWCGNCNRLVAMEEIPSLSEAIGALADLETHGADEEDAEAARLAELELAEYVSRRTSALNQLIRWRRKRFSPPRCLECGSTGVMALPRTANNHPEQFEHPGCGGVFRYHRSSIFSETHVQLLTTEGLPWTNRG